MGGFLLRRSGAALIVIFAGERARLRRRPRAAGRPGARARRREPRPGGARPRSGTSTGSTSRCRCSTCAGSARAARRPRHRPAPAAGRAHDRRRGCRSRSSSPASRSLIGSLIGIPAGVIAAVRRGKASDYAATTVALVGLSVPHFWLGLLMIILFAVDLHWLPAGGYVPFREDPVENLGTWSCRRSCSGRACPRC